MFHLLAEQAIVTSIDINVPFVATQYDKGPFADYAARRGFKDFNSLFLLNRERPDTFESLLQTWLFFGLLYEFFGEKLEMDDFVYEAGSATSLVSSVVLRGYCTNWFNKVFALDEDAKDETVANAFEVIESATRISNEIDDYIFRDQSAAPVIMLSVKILIECLTIVVKRFTIPLPKEDEIGLRRHIMESFEYRQLRLRPSGFLLQSMLRIGWCPFRLACISASLSSIALYHLRGFHYAALIGENHQACTEDSCCVDNLPEYPPQHDCECSGRDCELTHIELDKVVEIYKGNNIPILSCVLEPSGSLWVEVIPSSKCSGYIAISHVWSDGLGNKQENAVYNCQLKRLTEELRALQAYRGYHRGESEPVAFWLDTMFVPQAKEFLQTKKIALGRMNRTYAAADAVLVQDKALRKISPDDLFPLQLAAHLHCSKWLTRCWTLAEGTLAWKWYIQFSHSVLSLEDIALRTPGGRREKVFDEWVASFNIDFLPRHRQEVMNQILEEPRRQATFDEFLEDSILSELMSIYKEIPSHNVNLTFADTWNSMLHRGTSRLGDAHAILGLLTGLGFKQMFDIDEEERLKAVLNSLWEFPTSLLFNHGPKCNESKNR